jgi:hypothetical protein
MLASAAAVSSSANLYPDFSVVPSGDAGCSALTSTVSSQTGGLGSSPPAAIGSGAIDQEDTNYNTNEGGASFCSYEYAGLSMSLTSASATLFLISSDQKTNDTWPTTVSLVDLTSCTTYTSSSPCPSVASGTEDVTGVPSTSGLSSSNPLDDCANSTSFVVTLTLSASAALTPGHLYGMVVNSTSSNANGYNELALCTGGDPTMLTATGTSVINGVPEFPLGMAALLAVAIVGIMLIQTRSGKFRPALPTAN